MWGNKSGFYYICWFNTTHSRIKANPNENLHTIYFCFVVFLDFSNPSSRKGNFREMQGIRYAPNMQITYIIMNRCVFALLQDWQLIRAQNAMRSNLLWSIIGQHPFLGRRVHHIVILLSEVWSSWTGIIEIFPAQNPSLPLFAKYIWLSWLHDDSIELIRIPGELQRKIYCSAFGLVPLPQNTCRILNNGIVRRRVQSVEQ